MGAYYVNLISELHEAIKEIRRVKLRKSVILHHDDALSHASVAKITIAIMPVLNWLNIRPI